MLHTPHMINSLHVSWRLLVILTMLLSLVTQPVFAEPTQPTELEQGRIQHIPQRDLKIILATGWQMGECVGKFGNDLEDCKQEMVQPWQEWGDFERTWLNPDPNKNFYQQLSSLLTAGLTAADFLYYSYSGEWEIASTSSSCANGQLGVNGICLDFKRPQYVRIDTQIGYINESVPTTYARRASYMQEILDAFPNSEFIIIGHSLGGFTSAYWAGQADALTLERVNAVITLDSPLQGNVGPCTNIWIWEPTFSAPFLSNEEVRTVIQQAPNRVPLYTIRDFDDTFVRHEQATLAGAWTDTSGSFEDPNNPSECSHGGVKNSELVARLIHYVMVSGAIGNPTEQSPADAGNNTNPVPLLSSPIYLSKPTYYPGFMSPYIKFEASVNDAEATMSSVRFNPVVPGMTAKLTPPSQGEAGCFDLQILTEGAHIDSTDITAKSVCYSDVATAGTSDVALVIDRSCSMGCIPFYDPNKIIQARKSAKLVIDLLDEGDQATVVAFGDSATVFFPLTPLDTASRQQAKARIDAIEPDGGTSIGSGFLRALEQLEQSSDGRPQSIILLSDGVENVPPYWDNLRERVINSGVTVYVVGLGDQGDPRDLDEALLREIASQTGGSYYYSPSASDLRLIYDTIAGLVTNRQTIVRRGGFIVPGGSRTEAVSIDSTIQDVRFVLTWDTNQRNLEFTLQTPSGVAINASNATSYGVEVVQEAGYILYKITNPEPGIWNTIIRDMPLRSGERAAQSENYSLGVSGQSTLSLDLSLGDPLDLHTYRAYDPIPVLVTITSLDDIVSTTVRGEIRMPSGDVEQFLLFDNGGHGDGAANDGIYGFVVDFAAEPGSYTVVVTAEGETAKGENFQRTVRKSIVLDSNPTPPADLQSMIVSIPGTTTDTPEFCLSYANRGPAAANNVALFVYHSSGDLTTPSPSALPGLLGYDLGWSLGSLPAGAIETLLVHGSNIISNTTGIAAHAVIGNDVNLQTGLSNAPTTIDRNFANNVSVFENEFDINLSEGWNLVSLPRELTNPEVGAVLCASQGNIELILGFDREGLTYDPSLPEFNTLQEFQEGLAYWIKTTQPSVLRINGVDVSPQKPLFLNEGWNLISFLPNSTMPVEEAFDSLGSDVELVLGFVNGATSYYSSIPPELNTLSSLEPGQGYWLKLNRPSVLVYPTQTVSSREQNSVNRPQLTGSIAATNEWINVYSTNSTYNGQPLPVGTVVTAIAEDGRPLGQVVVREHGWYGLLAVYGDDGYTAELDGARPGERISFLINGQPAVVTNGVTTVWTANGDLMQVDLAASGPAMDNRLYLPQIQH